MKWQIIAEERLRNEVELASVDWMRRTRSSNRIAGDCLSIFFWQLDQFDPALIRDASSHMFLASLDTHLVIRDSVGPDLTDQNPERQVKRCSCSSDWPTICSGLSWSIWWNLCPPTYKESLPLTMLRLSLWLKVRKWLETVQYNISSVVESINSSVAELVNSRLSVDGKLLSLETDLRELRTERSQDMMVMTSKRLIMFLFYFIFR